MREDRGEIDAAHRKAAAQAHHPRRHRGDLHTHTTASDGTATIEEMAEAAKALGYEYLAITDHSKALAMANGLSVERLLKHIETSTASAASSKGSRCWPAPRWTSSPTVGWTTKTTC